MDIEREYRRMITEDQLLRRAAEDMMVAKYNYERETQAIQDDYFAALIALRQDHHTPPTLTAMGRALGHYIAQYKQHRNGGRQ